MTSHPDAFPRRERCDATTSRGDAPPSNGFAPTRRAGAVPGDAGNARTAPPEQLGRYPVVGVLGVGGMGEVLEVSDPALARTVALKVIRGQADARQVDKFLLEARVTGQLEHPGIPPVYELGTSAEGQAYFTMKRVNGSDLARLIERDLGEGRTRPLAEWLGIFAKICEAMAFAHAKGVIHRDLKPANIMVGAYGEVLVMDWGLARVHGAVETPHASGQFPAAASTDELGRTQEGAILGTPAYMPPEQARGEIARLDERGDIYALGAILYEILAGVPSFAGSSALAVIAQVLDQELVPPSARAGGREVPWELEAIVLRAMAREPEDRYPDVLALQADVLAFLDGRRVRAARYGVVATARNWARRHRAILRIATAIVVTALVFGVALGVQALRARVAHREAIRWERRLIEEADPTRVRDEAAALVARAHPDAALRLSPSPSDKERYTAHLARLRALAVRYTALLELDRDDEATRQALFDTLVIVGRLATVAEEQVLAEHALAQAASLDVNCARAVTELETSRAARDARAARHAARVQLILERVRAGQLQSSAALDPARIEVASYRDRATVEALLRELDLLTARLAHATRAALVGTAIPTADERQAGWTELPELAPALDRWLASRAPGVGGATAPRADQEARAAGRVAGERLVLRDRALRGGDVVRPRTLSELLGEAQSRALAEGGLCRAELVRFVCECLGYLGDGDGPPAALAQYCWVEWDELRAVPAGLALVRLRPAASCAQALIEELGGVRSRPDGVVRWDVNGTWWMQVAGLVRELRADGIDEMAGRREAGELSVVELAEEGRGCLARGDLEQAIEVLDRVLALDPTNVGALIHRGGAHYERGALDPALADLNRAIELDPRSPTAHNNRGLVLAAQGDLQAALADFDLAHELDPSDPRFLARRALARAQAGDQEGALADHDAALALDPNCIQSLAGRAGLRLSRGDLAGALADCDRLIAVNPREASGYINRAVTRSRMGESKLALADAERAIELAPNHPDVLQTRANSRFDVGDFVGAASDLERALSLEPARSGLYYSRGNVRRALGDLDGATADYDRALELDPRAAPAHVNRGLVRAQRGDVAGALEDYTQAAELDPMLATAWANRAFTLHRLGQLELALESFDRALALAPSDAYALTNRASLFVERGEIERAIADYDRALAADPRMVRAWTCRGRAKLRQGDVAGALADHDKAIELDPTDPGAHLNRSAARKANGDVAGAALDIDRAIALDPACASAFTSRASARLERGEVTEAMADFERAIALEPTLSAAWNGRGLARKLQGDLAGAIADYDRAIELDPRDAAGYGNRGNARRARGEFGPALADLDRAIELAPRNDSHYNNRGLARAAAGDADGAVADYSRAIELEPRAARPWFNRGNVHVGRGDLDLAMADYDRAIALDLREARLYTNRGNVRQRKGDLEAALTDYARAIELDPRLWQPRCMSGRAFGRLGRRAEALAALAKARELAPPDAHNGIDAEVREIEKQR